MNVKTYIKNLPKMFKRIDGISLWEVNKTLKKLSKSKWALDEQVKDDAIILFLPAKLERAVTTVDVKRELLKEIESLDGFETLQVSILENCKPIYKEQVTQYGLYRWIEIPVPETAKLEYSMADVKEKILENYSINHSMADTTIPLS